jgi:hypothetical protein
MKLKAMNSAQNPKEKAVKPRLFTKRVKVTLEYHEKVHPTIAQKGKHECKRYLFCILVNKTIFIPK